MFLTYLKSITAELSKKGFSLVFSDMNGKENTNTAVFAKAESPMLYLVSAANFDNILADNYESSMNAVMTELLEKAGGIFNNAVCVNILYSDNIENVSAFADGRGLVRDEKIHNVWWYTDGRRLGFGKGQPNRLNGIEKCAEKALDSVYAENGESIENISRREFAEGAMKPVEKFPAAAAVLIALNIIIFAVQALMGLQDSFVRTFGINRELIFGGGQIYRFFTYMFIHGGVEHIMLNSFSLYIFGTRAEKYCGRKSMLITYVFSGVCGGLLSACFNGGYAVGASGAIFGLLALIIVTVKKSGRKMDGLGYMTMLIMAAASIGMGFLDAGCDNFGHIGGFAAGLIAGAVLSGRRKE